MRLWKTRACAPRARDAGTLSAALLACALAAAFANAGPQGGARSAADAASIVGTWQATINGLRVGTLTIVPNGEGFGGAFVGYDYAGKVQPGQPLEGPPPPIAIRTGSLLNDAKLEGNALTFKMHLRHPSPPPGRPGGFDVSGEVRFQGEGAAELRLSAPHKPEPLVMKLTRE